MTLKGYIMKLKWFTGADGTASFTYKNKVGTIGYDGFLRWNGFSARVILDNGEIVDDVSGILKRMGVATHQFGTYIC